MVDIVLFDYDGTLMDTEGIILASWRETYRVLEVPYPGDDAIRGTFGEILSFSMGNAFPGRPVEEALKIYRDYMRVRFNDWVRPFPGMPEGIRTLREQGLRTGLVTARLPETTYMGLRTHGLEPLFDVIVTEGDVPGSKPDPAPMFHALEQLGMERETVAREGRQRVLYIGDTGHDYRFARSAGVSLALVAWSSSLERLEPGESGEAAAGEEGKAEEILFRQRSNGEILRPDACLEAPTELSALLERLRGAEA